MNLIVCLRCQSACPQQDDVCWMCDAKLVHGQTAKHYSRTSYSLTSSFLVMTLICVSCAIAAVAPGLGILIGIVATPALIRTVLLVGRRKQRGIQPTTSAKVTAFLGYAAVAVLAGLSAVVAFFGCCFVACIGMGILEDASGVRKFFGPDGNFATSMAIAAIAGVVVFIYMNVFLGVRE